MKRIIGVVGVLCGLVWAVVGCQSAQPVDLFAQQTQRAALTPSATPDVSPIPTETPSPSPTPTPIPTEVGGNVGGLRVSIVESQGINDYWLPADGQTTVTVRLTTLSEAFSNRPVTVIASGGGGISGGATTTATLGQDVDFTYTADVAAGVKRIEAQVTMADGRFEVRTTEVTVTDESPTLRGELSERGGIPRLRLTVTSGSDMLRERYGLYRLRGTYKVRVLADTSLTRFSLPDGSDIPPEGLTINQFTSQTSVPDGSLTIEIAIQRLTAWDTINLSAFIVGRGESAQWRDKLYPQYATNLSFTQLNGVSYPDMPEGVYRYMWDTRLPLRTWCVELRGAEDLKPPLVTFKITPILELNPGLSNFRLEGQPLALGEMARTDDPRFSGTYFSANYDICSHIDFGTGTGGVYQLEATAGLTDRVAFAPVVMYSGGGATFQVGGLWLALYDFAGNLLPSLEMSNRRAPYVYFIESQTPQDPAHAVVVFWAKIDPVAAEGGVVKPLDGESLHFTGHITDYIDSKEKNPTSTPYYKVDIPNGLGRAWIFVDNQGRRYTHSVEGEVWTRVYAIALIASDAQQLMPPIPPEEAATETP